MHVLPASDDDFLEPATDEQVAFFIEVADIAGVHPTIAEGLRGFRRIVVIGGDRIGRAAEDLTGLADCYVLALRVDDAYFGKQYQAAGGSGLVQAIGGRAQGQ
ncbi:hypothetical protein D3C80_864140 [compost metagenome]